MSLNWTRARQLLAGGDLRSLFVDALGWDHYATPLDITVNGSILTLSALAHKRGMVAYHCPTPSGHRLPDSIQRAKIERQVAKLVYEHLIVFTNAENETQIWYWVKREPGKPAVARPHIYHRSQRGDALLQKIEAIAFALEEEEALSQTDVTRRTRAAFDVERVTKRFYDRFQKEHAAFLSFVEGITKQGDREWYASVMLNRLMFVYFIQRKGFLDNDRDYLRNRLDRVRAEYGRDKFYSFYRYFLLRLFHEGLGGRKRTSELEKLLGHIPFVNGGLFDVHELERPDRYGKNIQIQDRAFECIFDFLDGYDWILDPTHQDIGLRNADPQRTRKEEINPDVLGYIFEKYINAIQPGEQKAKGAYYTKEDITEYISKNTVLPFLLDAARAKCKVAFENLNGPTVWDLLKSDPDRYIYSAVRHGLTWDYQSDHPQRGMPLERPHELPDTIAAGLNPPTLHKPVGDGPVETLELRRGWNKPAPAQYALPTEIWREAVARRKRYEDIKTKLTNDEVRDINDLVTLNLDIRQFAQDVIANCEGPDLLRALWRAIETVTVLDPTCGSGAFLFAALNILEPLYQGCLERMEAFVEDLDRSGEKHRPEKFRDFRKVLGNLAAHPNRRYFILKSIMLNNLYGVDIMEEAVEICKLRLFLKLAAQVDPDTAHKNLGFEPLPDIDFNIRAGNTLVGFTSISQVRDAAENEQERNELGWHQSRMLLGDADERISRIEQAAADLQQILDAFRSRQIDGDGSVPTEDKQELRERLNSLDDELNGYLAGEYGVEPSKKDSYAKWIKSHQPFHWFVEFYGIMRGDRFDVIIGNPPYVEYRLVRDTYYLPKSQYASEPAGNLYAFCMERSCSLLRGCGWFGMIVPTGVLGLDETLPLREVLAKRFSTNWFSTYAIRPSKLFDGVDQRLCICLETHRRNEHLEIWTTRYQHWNDEERPHLFPIIEYALSNIHDRLKRVPQVGRRATVDIMRKLDLKHQKTAAHYYSRTGGSFVMHYHRSPRYWIRAMDFEQYFKSPTRTRSVHHFRDLRFAEKRYGRFIGGLLNSTLFFLWFISIGNGRNITGVDVEQMPVGEVDDVLLRDASKLFDRLMNDYQNHSFIRERQDCEFQEFRPSMSKAILDELDQLIARHYGFTEEELDFIINYDIKYRMGRGAEGGDE